MVPPPAGQDRSRLDADAVFPPSPRSLADIPRCMMLAEDKFLVPEPEDGKTTCTHKAPTAAR